MLGFLSAPMGVAYQIVVALAQFLTPLAGGLATAAAIVVFTAAVRLVLFPLSYHAFRGQASMSALQPKIAGLRKRYSGQPDRLQQELTALYRAEGGGMLAGCLPLLLQLPFFSIMYRLFLSNAVDGRANGLLTRHLLSTPLGSHWLTGAGPASTQGLLFIGLFAVLAGVAFVTARLTKAGGGSPVTASGQPASPGQPASSGQPAGLGLLGRVLPYTTVVIAAFVPLAAGIYLLTTTSWTAAERAVLRRWLTPRPEASPAAVRSRSARARRRTS